MLGYPLQKPLHGHKSKVVENIIPKLKTNESDLKRKVSSKDPGLSIPCGFCPARFNTFFAKTNHWSLEHSDQKKKENSVKSPKPLKNSDKLSKSIVKTYQPSERLKVGSDQVKDVASVKEIPVTSKRNENVGIKSKNAISYPNNPEKNSVQNSSPKMLKKSYSSTNVSKTSLHVKDYDNEKPLENLNDKKSNKSSEKSFIQMSNSEILDKFMKGTPPKKFERDVYRFGVKKEKVKAIKKEKSEPKSGIAKSLENIHVTKCQVCDRLKPSEKFSEHLKDCKVYFRFANKTAIGFKCQICSLENSDYQTIFSHVKEIHSIQVKIGLKNLKKETLKYIRKVGAKKFKCSICSKEKKSLRKIIFHLKDHHPEKTEKVSSSYFVDSVCNKVMKSTIITESDTEVDTNEDTDAEEGDFEIKEPPRKKAKVCDKDKINLDFTTGSSDSHLKLESSTPSKIDSVKKLEKSKKRETRLSKEKEIKVCGNTIKEKGNYSSDMEIDEIDGNESEDFSLLMKTLNRKQPKIVLERIDKELKSFWKGGKIDKNNYSIKEMEQNRNLYIETEFNSKNDSLENIEKTKKRSRRNKPIDKYKSLSFEDQGNIQIKDFDSSNDETDDWESFIQDKLKSTIDKDQFESVSEKQETADIIDEDDFFGKESEAIQDFTSECDDLLEIELESLKKLKELKESHKHQYEKIKEILDSVSKKQENDAFLEKDEFVKENNENPMENEDPMENENPIEDEDPMENEDSMENENPIQRKDPMDSDEDDDWGSFIQQNMPETVPVNNSESNKGLDLDDVSHESTDKFKSSQKLDENFGTELLECHMPKKKWSKSYEEVQRLESRKPCSDKTNIKSNLENQNQEFFDVDKSNHPLDERFESQKIAKSSDENGIEIEKENHGGKQDHFNPYNSLDVSNQKVDEIFETKLVDETSKEIEIDKENKDANQVYLDSDEDMEDWDSFVKDNFKNKLPENETDNNDGDLKLESSTYQEKYFSRSEQQVPEAFESKKHEEASAFIVDKVCLICDSMFELKSSAIKHILTFHSSLIDSEAPNQKEIGSVSFDSGINDKASSFEGSENDLQERELIINESESISDRKDLVQVPGNEKIDKEYEASKYFNDKSVQRENDVIEKKLKKQKKKIKKTKKPIKNQEMLMENPLSDPISDEEPEDWESLAKDNIPKNKHKMSYEPLKNQEMENPLSDPISDEEPENWESLVQDKHNTTNKDDKNVSSENDLIEKDPKKLSKSNKLHTRDKTSFKFKDDFQLDNVSDEETEDWESFIQDNCNMANEKIVNKIKPKPLSKQRNKGRFGKKIEDKEDYSTFEAQLNHLNYNSDDSMDDWESFIQEKLKKVNEKDKNVEEVSKVKKPNEKEGHSSASLQVGIKNSYKPKPLSKQRNKSKKIENKKEDSAIEIPKYSELLGNLNYNSNEETSDCESSFVQDKNQDFMAKSTQKENTLVGKELKKPNKAKKSLKKDISSNKVQENSHPDDINHNANEDKDDCKEDENIEESNEVIDIDDDIQIIPDDGVTGFKCALCPSFLTSMQDMNNHIKNDHSDENTTKVDDDDIEILSQFSCSLCNKDFAKIVAL